MQIIYFAMSNYQYTYTCLKLLHNIFCWCKCLTKNDLNTKTKIIILEYFYQILYNFNNAVSKIMQYLINIAHEHLKLVSYFCLALIDKMYRLANLLTSWSKLYLKMYHLLQGKGPTYSIVTLIFLLGCMTTMSRDLCVVDFIQNYKRGRV